MAPALLETPWMARSASIAIFALNALLTLAYHVRAEEPASMQSPPSFYERLKQGPDGFTTEDKILVGAFVTLAFEFLDFCCKRSGSK
jgi:hypothetical protein